MRLASPAGTAVMAAAFGLISALVRLTAGTRLAMDDAKTNLFTQKWQWGYQADNPPLYEWLIALLHPLTGGGLISFLLLKYLCLAAAALFMHLAARRLLLEEERETRERVAFGTAMGMILLYQVGYNFHQAFTHSALLVAMCCAGLYVFLRLVQERRLLDYLLFGAVLGTGIMAKYNFVLLAVPLLAAAAVMTPFRRAVFDPRLLLSLAIASLILAPHAFWLLARADAYAATLDTTLGLEGSRLGRLGSGLLSLLVAVISFFLPYAVFAFFLRGGTSRVAPERRLLLPASALSLGLLVLGILLFGIGDVSERYVIPVLLPAYAALTARLLLQRPDRHRFWLFACLGVGLLFTLIRLLALAVAGPPFCDLCGRFVPYEVLTDRLGEVTPEKSIYIAYEENTAGNLVAAFPKARVRSLNLMPFMNPTDEERWPCFLVWSEEMVGGLPLVPIFAFAYDDPHTVIVDAPWRHPLKETGFRRTGWGITPLEGDLYERFCTPHGKG